MGAAHLDLSEIHLVGPDTRERRVGPEDVPQLRAFGVRRTGVSDAGAGYAFVKRASPLAHVVASLAGTGEVLVDGAWRRCGPGLVYLLPASRPHGFRTIRSSRWTIAWMTWVVDSPVAVEAASVVEADGEPLRAAIDGLWRERVGAADAGILAQWAALAHAQAQRLARAATGHSRLWAIWRAVDDDPGRAWSLDALARLAGVGPEQLRRLCRRHHGRSPVQQVTALRMRRAAGWLAAGEGSVEVIAGRVGYANPFAFSMAFKRVIGSPPSRLLPRE